MTDNVWFTADQHFRHENVVSFCNRPFSSIEEHDEHLIQAWNSRVGKGDRVYVLGDFCWRGDATPIMNRLKGQMFLIRGNHDLRSLRKHTRWVSVRGWKEIKVEDQHIIMCHFPLATWPGSKRGVWMLHGHVHNGIGHDKLPIVPWRFDVGVDGHPEYAPWGFEELREKLAARSHTIEASR